ncbi:hypothetical protein MHYP_G00135870 [Metynnis hypsauchen]
MTKGGKRYANMEKDGIWFAHVDVEQSEKTREACTSTGSMLAQGVHQPIPLRERYSKMNLEKKAMGRSYPFSEHNNRATLQNTIETYDHGLGRKKCPNDRSQHNSHFCLCHDGNMSAVGLEREVHSAYQTDFVPNQGTESRENTNTRRFPKSHLERSHQAATIQAGECYVWFGRHDLDHHIPLNVLAASHHSSCS